MLSAEVVVPEPVLVVVPYLVCPLPLCPAEFESDSWPSREDPDRAQAGMTDLRVGNEIDFHQYGNGLVITTSPSCDNVGSIENPVHILKSRMVDVNR